MPGYALSRSARRELDGIREYLAPAPEAIRQRQIDRLQETFRLIAEFRQCGRREPALRSLTGEVRSFLSFPYRIYYLPQTDPVQIVSIRHGRLEPFAPGRMM